MNKCLANAAVFVLASLPIAAVAHTGHGSHGLIDGLVHPFLGLDHLLAMLVVGVWAVLHARNIWLAPTGFVVCLTIGAALGQQGLIVPQIEPLLAVSVVVLGLILAHPLKLAAVAPLALIGSFALVHGIAHGGELAAGAGTLAGIILGSAALHASGMGFAHFVLKTRPRLARCCGQIVALLGGGLLFANVLA